MIDECMTFLAGGFLKMATIELRRWRDELPAESDIGKRLRDSLGAYTERKTAIVFEFLNIYQFAGSRVCSEDAWQWLSENEAAAADVISD